MTWVKVCGLSTKGDVAAAVAAGADAVGFVVAPGSPRRISLDQAAALGAGVPVLRVLVAIGLDAGELLDAAARADVDAVQPTGANAAAAAAAAVDAGLVVIRPVAVGGAVDLAGGPADQLPLLDAASPNLHGGTGRAFDWDLAAGIERDYVLAGGLGPDNVGEAIRRLGPWGVDASSGMETAPGVKDPALVERFVKEAKSA